MNPFRIRLAILLLLLLALGGAPRAHDANSYGGVFRSRDLGATWLNADVGLFLNAPLAVAVDPQDSLHLLMGTDLGLLSSHNGGRSWTIEAGDLIVGAVFAVAFLPAGQALCAAQGGVFRSEAGSWTPARVPAAAIPARAFAAGAEADRIYLLGADKLLRSDDGGRSFVPVQEPTEKQIAALAVIRAGREALMAVADGAVMTSDDGGSRWHPTTLGSREQPVDLVTVDTDAPERVWAAQADRVYKSDDRGATWVPVGRSLPEPGTKVRGIAADRAATTLVLTTHRGTYRSEDGGQTWILQERNLPIHLEAGPLARDPGNGSVIYVPYSLVPYEEVWRAAIEGRPLLARLELTSLMGVTSAALLLLLGGGLVVRCLARLRIAPSASGQPHR
ncbi:WD40/YVTN/BNR-like repeat-containing protein [Microvirga massiliensis]|uniref:WD40/YVTN/BNR-like repeat-containing protein n=1 Tax=Microvirga massiliensis TaxID=1033741 RepID=UPI00062BE061|nr:YCF48-related protein [Microvirga massiliensis]